MPYGRVCISTSMVDHEKILSKSHFDPEKALSASRSRQCGAAENRVGAMAEGVAEVTFEVDLRVS